LNVGFRRHKNRRRRDAEEVARTVKTAVRRIARAIAWTALMGGAFVGVVWGGIFGYRWVHTSPRFALTTVVFRGLRHAQETELRKLAGLGPGQNLFQLDVPALERAMAAHPWVKSVSIARRFPPALWVTVNEHVAVAMVALGDLYLVDEEGVPFKKVQSGEAVDHPLVTGIGREQFVQSPEASRIRMRHALKVAAAYSRSEVGDSPLSEVRLSSGGVTLVTGSGQELRMGEGDTPAKLARLKRVRMELERRGLLAQMIQLDNRVRPGWVAVRISNAASERKGADR
jgi:cell division protein FtsQ